MYIKYLKRVAGADVELDSWSENRLDFNGS